jgi:hypothetical protein
MDVFATGTDGAVYHFWWSDETWYGPESFQGDMTSAPTAISVSPNHLNVLAPGKDQNIYHRAFDGAGWTPAFWDELGGHVVLPTRYRFSVDFVTCDEPRSFISDTDTAQATISPGNWPLQSISQAIGDIGGTHPSQAQTNLLNFEPVTVELCEDVSFNYIVVNNGHADQVSLDTALISAGSALASAGIKAATGSSILGAVAGWLLGKLGSFLFQDCDGIVAVEQVTFSGRDLHLKTENNELGAVITVHPGTDSPSGCGGNSQYEVTWSITGA